MVGPQGRVTGPCRGGSVVGLSPEPVGPVLTLGGVRIEFLDTLLVLENWLVFSKLHTFSVRRKDITCQNLRLTPSDWSVVRIETLEEGAFSPCEEGTVRSVELPALNVVAAQIFLIHCLGVSHPGLPPHSECEPYAYKREYIRFVFSYLKIQVNRCDLKKQR